MSLKTYTLSEEDNAFNNLFMDVSMRLNLHGQVILKKSHHLLWHGLVTNVFLKGYPLEAKTAPKN